MAKPRRAERERNTTEPIGDTGSNPEPERNQQQQSDLPDENRNIAVVEPESAQQSESGSSSTSSGSRRSSKSRNSGVPRKQARIDPQKSKEGLAVLLTGIHAMGAKLVHECLALDKKEAEQLSEAIFTVNELYDNGLISPKAAAWGNLVLCAGTIYGPRAMVMLFKKKLAAQASEQKG